MSDSLKEAVDVLGVDEALNTAFRAGIDSTIQAMTAIAVRWPSESNRAAIMSFTRLVSAECRDPRVALTKLKDMKVRLDKENRERNEATRKDDAATHCGHWLVGDGECCRCQEPNWCPEEGETPAAHALFEQRKHCDKTPYQFTTRQVAEMYDVPEEIANPHGLDEGQVC